MSAPASTRPVLGYTLEPAPPESETARELDCLILSDERGRRARTLLPKVVFQVDAAAWVALMRVDRGGVIISANAAAYELADVPSGEALPGRMIFDFMSAELAKAHLAKYLEAEFSKTSHRKRVVGPYCGAFQTLGGDEVEIDLAIAFQPGRRIEAAVSIRLRLAGEVDAAAAELEDENDAATLRAAAHILRREVCGAPAHGP